MIAVLGAMKQEVAGIISRMTARSQKEWGVISVHEGCLRGRSICCARTGVGKVMAAVAATHIIHTCAPEALLYVGIAGALWHELDIGDLVLASESLQHDLDATPFGFARGEVPYDPIRWLPSDPSLLSVAREYRPASGKLVTGRIVTGDQFCTTEIRESRPYLSGELGGIAIDMEGAAAATAALLAGVPFLHARIISDRADGTAAVDFPRFLPVAAGRLADFVEYLITGIS